MDIPCPLRYATSMRVWSGATSTPITRPFFQTEESHGAELHVHRLRQLSLRHFLRVLGASHQAQRVAVVLGGAVLRPNHRARPDREERRRPKRIDDRLTLLPQPTHSTLGNPVAPPAPIPGTKWALVGN